MKKNNYSIATTAALFCLMTALISSCSVSMAARKSGTDISKIQSSHSRDEILATGAEIINAEKDTQGNLIETYKVQKEQGSAIRAIMHGILDLSTFFIWEAIGTPIEGSLNKKEYFNIKVFYNSEQMIKKVELL